MPSFEPKMLQISMPWLSAQPSISQGVSGAEPLPIARSDERFTEAVICGCFKSAVSTAGGAMV